MNALSPETISQIRQDKTQGLSLLDISLKYRCSKSTASYYCRDLFSHPNRKYQTEEDARKRLAVTHKNTPKRHYPSDDKKYPHASNHGHKLVPCIKCQKPIRKSKSGLCVNCYYAELAKSRNDKDKQKEQNRIKRMNARADKLSRNYHPTVCKDSPNGAHRWLINSDNVGTCFYCGHSEKMPELKKSFVRTAIV